MEKETIRFMREKGIRISRKGSEALSVMLEKNMNIDNLTRMSEEIGEGLGVKAYRVIRNLTTLLEGSKYEGKLKEKLYSIFEDYKEFNKEEEVEEINFKTDWIELNEGKVLINIETGVMFIKSEEREDVIKIWMKLNNGSSIISKDKKDWEKIKKRIGVEKQ